MSPAQQVLVKGVQICLDNLSEIVKYVENQFHLLEKKIADVSAASLDQLYIQRVSFNILSLTNGNQLKEPMMTSMNFISFLLIFGCDVFVYTTCN